jgi:hypothetical protein
MENKYKIKLTMGDWSHDGHGLTEHVMVMCNLTATQLQQAYKRGCEKVGFDFTRDVAASYEDNVLPQGLLKKLEEQGFVPKEFASEWADPYDGEKFRLGPDNFWQIWMFVAGLSSTLLDYEEVTGDFTDVRIGGYGLFSG